MHVSADVFLCWGSLLLMSYKLVYDASTHQTDPNVLTEGSHCVHCPCLGEHGCWGIMSQGIWSPKCRYSNATALHDCLGTCEEL